MDNNEPWLDAEAVLAALDELDQGDDAPPCPDPDWLIMGMM